MHHLVFHGARVALCAFLGNLHAASFCWSVEAAKRLREPLAW